MVDFEKKVIQRIDALRREIEFLEQYVSLTQQAKELIGDVDGGIQPHTIPATPGETDWTLRGANGSPRSVRRGSNPKPSILIPAVINILKEKGYPMSRKELHEALATQGLVVQGADPTKTLGTILWRARPDAGGPIDSIEGRGYWPKGEPVPEVGLEELLG